MAVDFLQLHAEQPHLLEDLGIEEIEVGVIGREQLAVVLFHYRLQLEDIAHQQQLLAAEGLPHVLIVDSQHLVYEVYDVGPYHAYLVYDDQLQRPEQFYLLGVIAQCLAEVAHAIAAVVGQ